MSILQVANVQFETTGANRIEYTGNNVVRVRANGGFQLPFGTTAQRAPGETGLMRYNTDTGLVESYGSGAWSVVPDGVTFNAAYTTANAGYVVANAAFGKANTALQNTTTTLSGTLTISSASSGLANGLYVLGGDVTAARSTSTGAIYFGSDSANKYLYHDGTNYIFGTTGYVTMSNSVRAPIFYDTNDTTYYVDPASATTSAILAGKVGIGTATPQSLLDITASSGNDCVLSLTAAGTRRFQIKSLTSVAALTFHDEGYNIERMRIDSGGKVGIATTTPTGIFDVRPSAATTGKGASVIIKAQRGQDGFDGGNLLLSSGDNGVGNNNGYIAFGIGSVVSGNDFTTTSETARLSSVGYFGIGTTAPGSKLHVANGNISITSSTGAGQFTITDDSDLGRGLIFRSNFGTSNTYIGTNSSVKNLIFGIDQVEKMRLDYSGNVGIGSAPSYKLDVYGTVRLGYNGVQGNPSSTDITSNTHTLLSGTGGNYLAFGQYSSGSTYAQWIQSAYQNPSTAVYNLVLQPVGGNVGIGSTAPLQKLEVVGVINSTDASGQNRSYIGWKSGSSYGSGLHFINVDNSSILLGTNNTVRASIDTNGQFAMNSGFGSVATAYGVRSWSNFDGGAASVRGSGNVSSVTRNNSGIFTVNFSSSMPDAVYSVGGSATERSSYSGASSGLVMAEYKSAGTTYGNKATGAIQVCTVDNGGDSLLDSWSCNVIILR